VLAGNRKNAYFGQRLLNVFFGNILLLRPFEDGCELQVFVRVDRTPTYEYGRFRIGLLGVCINGVLRTAAIISCLGLLRREYQHD
jgi:hypothetical protein